MQSSTANQTILVGIDFSECSERALLRAITIAEQHHAQLLLTHVFAWDWSSAERSEATPTDTDTSCSGLRKAVAAQAQSSLQRLARLCSDFVADRVPAEIRVFIGDPTTELLKAAEQSAAALIVIGEIGRRPLDHGTVGGTAAAVCRKSAIPVLLVAAGSSQDRGPRPVQLPDVSGQPLWRCRHCGTAQSTGKSALACNLCDYSFLTRPASKEPHATTDLRSI